MTLTLPHQVKPGNPEGEAVRLGSASLVHTPGLFRWLANVYRTDPAYALQIALEGYSEAPGRALLQALDGRAILTVEDGNVLVIQPTDAPAPGIPGRKADKPDPEDDEPDDDYPDADGNATCDTCGETMPYSGDWYCGDCPSCADNKFDEDGNRRVGT